MPRATQTDLVNETLPMKNTIETIIVKIPGIESLHTKSISDIAEAMAMVIKANGLITEFKWVVGKYFEITRQVL